MNLGHAFMPSTQDPTRCAVLVPTCAPYPEPLTQPCRGLAEQHDAVEGAAS